MQLKYLVDLKLDEILPRIRLVQGVVGTAINSEDPDVVSQNVSNIFDVLQGVVDDLETLQIDTRKG